ncbi:P-loop containing nucleoside triphosphate hydrolase protein [Multifurca ochricompacta]|uniref:P-loop containing nucleoside triphosphate hydrolase protein n=1 Tax=Multifurca ochricompacta TaxID=376703 RepID=A0AAD4MC74_9AGAM|nr:P-loop containing nucleoside triphosphate hydrolase protein [Multifurca ochricompacta]
MYTTDIDSASRLQSITQEGDLDEFLNTARLAETDFTAERRNMKIVQTSATTSQNSYLLSEKEEISTLKKQYENKQRLRVPRRPPWTKSISQGQLERQEKDAFLQWRRDLAELQDRDKFLLTPFERNLEVWRQLWRVIERSHLIVQIVDARNPLRFRCEDLEAYVQDVEGAEGEQGTGKGKRQSLLLINKADLLTGKQRRIWADYFDSQGIRYAFYSAVNATALQEALQTALATEELKKPLGEGTKEHRSSALCEENVDASAEEGAHDIETSSTVSSRSDAPTQSDKDASPDSDSDDLDNEDPRAKVLSVLELEDLFIASAPDLSGFLDASGKHPEKQLVVGLVGYPNVGKSSTINSLLGEKKVSVSSTPGKTKHFQTINLSDKILLCDCPGLVFPQFATTKADLVCDGVLPIDQLREHTGPVSLVVRRISKAVLEGTYGLNIRLLGPEEDSDELIRAEDLLVAYAVARGFTRSGQGNPDEARAARYILKDYVNAKLLFCHPPPDYPPDEFNRKTQELAIRRVAGKKRAPTTRVGKNADTYSLGDTLGDPSEPPLSGQSQKARALDKQFFDENAGLAARPFAKGVGGRIESISRPILYPHHLSVANDGTPLATKSVQIETLINNNGGRPPGKKAHKKTKRTKQRSGRGYD